MKVRIKSGDCPSYLTVGKAYDVIGGRILTDSRHWVFIKLEGSHHLNGGSWEIVSE